VDDTAGIAMIDADGKTERVADGFLQRHGVGIFGLAPPRLLLLALRHTLVVGQRLGLAHVETLFHDPLGGGDGIGHADQRAGMTGR
jgi:hypothetical protein